MAQKIIASLKDGSQVIIDLTVEQESVLESFHQANIAETPLGDDDAAVPDGQDVAARLALLEDAFIELLMLQSEMGA